MYYVPLVRALAAHNMFCGRYFDVKFKFMVTWAFLWRTQNISETKQKTYALLTYNYGGADIAVIVDALIIFIQSIHS